MDTAGSIFRRHWRLILLTLGIIITFWPLYVFRSIATAVEIYKYVRQNIAVEGIQPASE